jgi:acyl-CoA reductase-like NAD-dependent aldehyde dehydrogenase
MTDTKALIAEAEEAAFDWQDCAISEEADLLHRLATALREAQGEEQAAPKWGSVSV